MKFDAKHIFVKPEDWPKVKAAISNLFPQLESLDGFKGIILTTDEHSNLIGLSIQNKEAPQ